FTLGGTSLQPQNNVVGTIWWDNVTLRESESTADDLRGRGVKTHPAASGPPTRPALSQIDLGDPMLGDNVLRATLTNPGGPAQFAWEGKVSRPAGKKAQ